MKVDGYKNITIATIFAVFLLQTIWLYNSFSVAVNKLTADVNAFFIQCLFKELDGRFANIPPDAQIQGSNNPNPKYDNYEYINNGIFNLPQFGIRIVHKKVGSLTNILYLYR